MTVYRPENDFFVPSGYTPKLPPRAVALLTLCLDFVLDHSRARSLGEALNGADPLDVLRMLAQQWSLGLSTLSGDLDHQHDCHLKPSVAASFLEHVKTTLGEEPHLLSLPNDPRVIYNELLKAMARNQPYQAAWCAALLWQRPQTLN